MQFPSNLPLPNRLQQPPIHFLLELATMQLVLLTIKLESFGISASEHSVYDDFGSLVHFINECYEVELPWKESHPTLRDNYQLCLSRLCGLLKCLKHDPDVLQDSISIRPSSSRNRGICGAVKWRCGEDSLPATSCARTT